MATARCVLFSEVPGFYAAVARADDPTLVGRPVLVGGDPRKRGRVQAATPEALASGVRIDMPMLEALRCCPHAKVVRTDMARIREVSRRLLAVLRGSLPRLEPFGLGAAYAELAADAVPPAALAERCVETVSESLGLPLRVGIASGKFLARLAAREVAGESGVLSIAEGEEAAFRDPLPASCLDGVGPKTEAALAAMGALTVRDVARLGKSRLQEAFGPNGLRIHTYASGEDGEPVRAEQHPKSLSRDSTLEGETRDLTVLLDQLAGLAQQLEEELRRTGLAARRVVLRVRFPDRTTTTRTSTLPRAVQGASELREVGSRLLERTQAGARTVRGLGLQVALLGRSGESDGQLDLFS